jgi:phage terminase large subunit
MPTITLPNNWSPRPYQRRLWDYLEKGGTRAIEIAHRRWGKDDLILHRTAIAAFERPASYWHCLPEYEQARKAIWTAVNPHTGKRRIDEAFPPEIRASKDEQQMFIRFKNGSTWQVIGSDRYNSLVGAGIAGVAFSEWALANPSSWGFIRPMIEENNGWAAFITTPRGRNHAKSMFDMAMKSDRWFAEISDVHKTGALTKEQLDESLLEYCALYGEDLGRAQFEQEYLCSFNAAIMGAFYAREMAAVRSDGRIGEVLIDEDYPVHTAWDLGVRDSTAIWWFQVIGEQIRIVDFYMAHSLGLDHYAEIIEKKGYPKGIDYVPHDAKVKEWGTGRTRYEQMKSHGLNPFVLRMTTKMDGIASVRKTLPQCVFDEKCEEGLSALEQYRREWDDEKKTFRDNEVHDWTSHAADAFRYLAQAWRLAKEPYEPKQKPKELIYEFKDGRVVSNMGIREIVEQRMRRKRLEGRI